MSIGGAKRWLGRRRDYREALELIARGGCENYTGGLRCWNTGRIKGAHFTAEAWCDPCIAEDALNRRADRVSPVPYPGGP